MSEERVRCDHCGKWQLYGDLLMPHTSEQYQDGAFAVCKKCTSNNKYDTSYWDKWYISKLKNYENTNE